MINEIGSEFWNIPVCDDTCNIFPHNTVWYLSGRCALTAIIKDIKKRINFKKIALPSWCCDSIITPFLNEDIEVVFYPVYLENGEFIQDFSNVNECDVLLIMDFFGYKRNIEYRFDGIVINDVTHSVFCGDFREADYTFGSLRKWAGFYTGGFAFAKDAMLTIDTTALDLQYIKTRELAMCKKGRYINGKSDSKDFLQLFAKAEELLEFFSCSKGADRDIALTKKLDAHYIKARRRENAQIILDNFPKLAIFQNLEETDCPLFVPLIIPNGKRDELRRYLIDKNIYCPVHWPLTKFHNINKEQSKIYNDEISIVCDQRYNCYDMERICKEINTFFTEVLNVKNLYFRK